MIRQSKGIVKPAYSLSVANFPFSLGKRGAQDAAQDRDWRLWRGIPPTDLTAALVVSILRSR